MAANVQIILARDVPNLGHIGELVSVRPGYARNYLVPQGLALPASEKRVTVLKHQQQVVEHKRRLLRKASEDRAQELALLQVTLTARMGEQGKLFGSISNRDIAKALAAQGQVLDHRDIKLDGPLKTVGLHLVDIRLEADVTTQIKVVIAAEEVIAPSAEDDDAGETDGATQGAEEDSLSAPGAPGEELEASAEKETSAEKEASTDEEN